MSKTVKAPKIRAPRIHDNGDTVAKLLRGMSIVQIHRLTLGLIEADTTIKPKVKLELTIKANRALDRATGVGYDVANPGSARMSLGLMIRARNSNVHLTPNKLRRLAGIEAPVAVAA